MNSLAPPGDFVTLPAGIDASVLRAALADDFGIIRAFRGLGDVYSAHVEGILTFLSDVSFLAQLNDNPFITGVFCRDVDRAGLRPDIAALVVDDPKFYFFSLMDYLARNFHSAFESVIAPDAEIGSGAHISPHSVVIGSRAIVEPGAFIAPGSIIGDDVIVRANATVGVDGFQHQRTSHGMVSPLHDGWLLVETGVEIGYSASVSRGFSYRPTRLGAGTKLDAMAYVAHGAEIGPDCILCTHVCVMGHAVVGGQAWLGPAALVVSRMKIGDRARVSLGSVVTTDVPAGATYTGNFAVPHAVFIADLKGRLAATHTAETM